MSMSFKKTKWLVVAAFVYGCAQAIGGLDDAPKWLTKGAYVLASGLVATGLIKARTNEDQQS